LTKFQTYTPLPPRDGAPQRQQRQQHSAALKFQNELVVLVMSHMAREDISPANKRLWKTIMDEKRTRIGIGSRFDTRFEMLIVAFLELPHVRTWHRVVVAQLLDGGDVMMIGTMVLFGL